MANSVLQPPTNPHFFQPLLSGFHSHLDIPLKFFSVHIVGRNERNSVELRSDACDKIWKVKMEGRRLTIGWKEFASAHDFRTGDMIIFRHEGDLLFHVSLFGPSCCEIQYVENGNNDGDDQDKTRNLSTKNKVKTEPESSQKDGDKDSMAKLSGNKQAKKRILVAETKSFSADKSCFVAPITKSNLREDRVFLPRKFVRSGSLKKGSNKIVITNVGLKAWTLNLKFRESSGTFYMGPGWRSFCHENGLGLGDSVPFKLERNNTTTPLLRLSTSELKRCSKKCSTQGKKEKTGEGSERVPSSSSSLSESRFVTLTVTPATFKYHRLYLPVSFTRFNGMESADGKKVTVLDKNGVGWPVSLFMSKRNRSMHLGSGLKVFLKAVGVKAYESFVLKLVWEDTTSPPMLKLCSKIKT